MNRITRRPGYPAPRAMPSSAAIAIPTRGRPGYLDVALASIVPQAAEHGAEVVVVDDGPDAVTRGVARRHGVRYVAHERPLGLNVARNAAIDATDADLLVFVDDDVAVKPGWLGALVAAADACPPDVGVFTGPIHARIEDHRFPACGRGGPPITFLDVGPEDVDLRRAWGANMAIRRSAIDSVGRFAEDLEGSGDEEEWQARWQARGGRIRYVAAAALDHRRAGDDARLRRLARAAYHRGRAARRFDELAGTAPSLTGELRVLAGCALHGPRYRCAGGVTMTAHSAGRLRAALADPLPRSPAPTGAGEGDDFLSGASGTVGGRRGRLRRAIDAWLDVCETLSGRRARLADAAARTPDRQRVLVIGIERPGMIMDAARAELASSRHAVEIHTAGPGARGKFENLNALLRMHPPGGGAPRGGPGGGGNGGTPHRAAAHPPAGGHRLAPRHRRRRRAAAWVPRPVPARRRRGGAAPRAARAPPALPRRVGDHAPPARHRGARDHDRGDRSGDRVPPRHVRDAPAPPRPADWVGPRRPL